MTILQSEGAKQNQTGYCKSFHCLIHYQLHYCTFNQMAKAKTVYDASMADIDLTFS